MLRWRLLFGTIIVVGLVALCWLDASGAGGAAPGVWLLPVLVAFTVLATGEMLNLARAAGMNPLGWPVYCGNLLLVLGQWWQPVGSNVGVWLLAALAIGTLLVLTAEMVRYQKPGGATAGIAAAVFAMVYVGVMLSFAVRLRLDWGVGAMATWIIAVKMGDTGAYTVGRLIGRHKLCPRLSPGKTIEGGLGALLFSCLGAWAGLTWLVPAAQAASLGPWAWFPFGLLMGITGMIGDLAESLLKRDAGCKDSSTWMPGFGGILDILDSLLLSAPIAWLCWMVFSRGQ